MFMACVSEPKKIGLWEMKKEDWMKFKTKAGKPAKGIGVEYFLPFIPKIKVAARKALGPGRIGIWIDNAKVQTAAAARAAFARHFDDVVFQSPSSPEMNLLDAGVFPNMQAKVDLKNATPQQRFALLSPRCGRRPSRQSTSTTWPTACAGT